MQNNKDNKKLTPYPSAHISFIAGTTPKKVTALQRALARNNSNATMSSLTSVSILFDYRRHAPVDVSGLLDIDVDLDDLFGIDEFVEAIMPADAESMVKAEAEGKLSLLPANWFHNPGVSLDNFGAAGDPRLGSILAALNEDCLRRKLHQALAHCLNHNRQGQLLLAGMDVEDKPTRLPITCHCTAVGGMGPGAVTRFIEGIKDDARQYGVQAKTILDVMLRGDLPINDVHRANINETTFLKYIQARATGEYVDPITGRVLECPFDVHFLKSDQNCHGRLSSLDRFISHEAHCQNALWNSALSAQIHERLVDVENWNFDEHGDPLVGFTMSVSYIRRDSRKILAHHSNMSASMLAKALTSRPRPEKAREEALALARIDGVVETEDDYHLTSGLLTPTEFQDQSLIQHLRSNISDRIEGTSGWERANVLAEAINAIRSTDFSNTYEPAMTQEAEKILRRTIERLNSYMRQKLSGRASTNEDEKGYLDVFSILSFYRRIIQTSREIIMGKIGQVQQFAQPHQDVVNNALEELERVREHSWFWWLFHPFLAGRIADCLESSGRVFLESELQIPSCRVAIDNLLDKLVDILNGKLAELGMLNQNLKQVFASCKQQAKSWATKPSISDCPLGFDLANAEYLNESFNYTVAENGGEEAFVKNLVARFLSKYHSFSSLLGKSPDEIEQVLKQICQAYFEPLIKQTDVVTEFKRLYPNKHRQPQFFRQLVLESEGRILTVGESGKDIVWLKFVTVPSNDYIEWVKELIEKADPKPGKWEIIVDHNWDAVSVVQLRGGISLTPLIARHDLPEPDGWQEMVRRAIDRVSAMMVPPNPNERQLRRIFAKAIVTGQLVYDALKGFELRFSDAGPIPLGKEPDATMDKLRCWWPWIVRIESTFGHQVVVDDSTVTQRIEQLQLDKDSSENDTDLRLALINEIAISDLKKQLALLIPWARRLRVVMEQKS